MAISLKHKFQSAKADSADASIVRPSNWNDEHDLLMATARLLGRTAVGNGPVQELLLGNGLEFSGTTLQASAYLATKAQLDSAVSDLWALQPIGALIATSPWAFTPPIRITSKYRYIQLTAGLAGAGQYNEGALGSEVVSGSSPNVSATATIILAGSPLAGAAIRLINTEERFLRAGGPGTLQDSQNLVHAHGVTDPGHAHALTQNPLKGPYNGVNQDVGGGAGGSNVGVTTDNRLTGISIQGSGGNEARPRNMSVVYYMRIL